MGLGLTLFLIYLAISYIAGAIISLIILLENRDPAKTMSWLMMFILFPGIGLVVYAVSGRNIRKIKLFKTQKLANTIKEKRLFDTLEKIEEVVELEIESIKQNKLLSEEEDGSAIKRVISLLLKTGMFPFTKNNKVDVFIDGNEKFPHLIEDIRNAKDHIHLEYFIIKDSEIGRVIKNELIEKAKQGVKVRIIYDDVGCWRFWFNRKFFNEMRNVGIEIIAFLPTKFPIIGGKLNYRNHRKIVVIDGIIGYTGGINIGDEYLGKKEKFGYWRDTHIRLEGIAVYMLQMTFIIDWYYTTKKVIDAKKLFPTMDYVGDSMIQVVASGPDSDWEDIHYAYFTAICQAKRRVYIETPYFIPDESILKAIKSVALIGVEVIIIFPKIPDHKIVNTASHSYFEEILEAGGRVFLYNKGFIHSKVVIIDDEIASAGSANMDLRSFMLNFEVNAFIYDKKVIERMTDDFYNDLKCSKELTLENFKKRGFSRKVKESVARLFSPIL